MRLKRFEFDYVKTLKRKITDNLPRYQSDEFKLEEDELVDVPEVDIDSDLLDNLLEDPTDEFKCSKLVYEKMKGMNPLLASQESLWAYLSHRLLFKYVQQRWNDVFKDDKISESFIKNHWFGWKRNAIGRLWWNAYLTIDEDNKDDPFELTKVLYKQSDITQNLSFSDALFPNKNAILSILGFYKKHEEIFEPKGATNERNRFVTQSLNRWGGVKNLCYFTREDFTIELEKNLPTILTITAKDNHNDFEWIQG